jgi:tRNA (cytidine/uridine-2'-O-)-methyltransferase
MRLALYQPDIPTNTGTLMRLCACLGVPVDIIAPCGFPASDRSLRRALMDYDALLDFTLHMDWSAFEQLLRAAGRRLVAVETVATTPYADFAFGAQDVLLMGRETAGTPDEVLARCDAAVRIPMQSGARSLNVAMAGAMVLGEAMRQTARWPV